MSLAFEVIKNLTTEVAQNVAPYLVRTPYVIHEPDNSLFQYYIKPGTDEAWDKRADVLLGQYKELPWKDPQHHLSTRAVSKIGAKQFPQLGAIGFYKDLYTSQSYILTPVHDKQEIFDPPTLAAFVSGDVVNITITPPEDVTYSCYKVIMRSGYFAVEYVVYNRASSVPKPLVNGAYEVTAIGYNELTGTFSSPSNLININVTGGRSSWEPEDLKVSMRLSDLLDVNLVDLLNAQMLRFNAATQKWENVSSNEAGSNGAVAASAARITSVTVLASAWLTTDVPNRFIQTVAVEGLTEYSKVDLQPSDEQLVVFHQRAVSFTTVNEDGVLTVVAIGDKPADDYTIQATVTEVTV